MTTLIQHTPSISGELIKWQSNDMINNVNDDLISLDENVSQIHLSDKIIYI
jgi:hypothetical protein